jgi:DNA primase
VTTKLTKEWEDFRVRLSNLKDVIDPHYLVESLGFVVKKETPKELRCTCIVHGGDNPTSFRFNKERKTWVCFSHKCHEVFGNDIIGLIKATQKIEFVEAVEYLSKLTGDIGDGLDALNYRKEKERREFIENNKTTANIHPEVNEERLLRYRPLRSKFFNIESGFSDEILDKFEIAGGYKSNDGLIREIIPIRDTKGKLAAYSLRDIRPNASYESKYKITYGFDKDGVLYNLHKIIPVSKPIIIVEGFKSVWRLYEYGIKNVVAAIGSKITRGQCRLLCSHALHGAVIFFDNDIAGVLGTIDAYSNLKTKMDISPIFITETDDEGNGLDPADLEKETIYNYLQEYI